MRGITQDEFVARSTEKHGGKYGYSRAVYVNTGTKLTIACPKHGDFQQRPKNHLRGEGCSKCGDASMADSRRSSTAEFVSRATEKQGGKYSYGSTVFVDSKTKLTITCPEHGDFKQSPNSHLRGAGCPVCGGNQRVTQEEFITRAVAKHGGKYSYTRAVYVSSAVKLTITCPEHGDFRQIPNNHLRGDGCAKCAGTALSSTDEFVAQATQKHGGKYSYIRAVYVNSKARLTVTCPEHGDFRQAPYNHLFGQGCAKCAGLAPIDVNDFVARATEKHGGKYEYTRSIYINASSSLRITCPEHGDFEQRPTDHLRGAGCRKCADAVTSDRCRSSTAEFVSAAIAKHGERYGYTRAVYTLSGTKLTITCPEHGDFLQKANTHLNGSGCPRCRESRGERRIGNLLRAAGEVTGMKVIQEHTIKECKSKRPLPFDFALTAQGDLQGLIEYQGEQHYNATRWFGASTGVAAQFARLQRHDTIKRDYCGAHGIPLLVVPHWDYGNIDSLVKNFVTEIVELLKGKSDNA